MQLAQSDSATYRCGEFLVDGGNRCFSRGGVEVAVEPKVLAVLLQLLAHAGDLVTRDQLLDAVWGHRFVTPSTLNRVIALARRAFADDSEGPRYIQTVHGSGYRFIGPVDAETVTVAEPQATFGPPPTARLPARLQTLIGREDEMVQMERLLADGRALTLVGAGGMGKTQCALDFARQTSDQYPDGVWFFDLVPIQRPGEWLRALAASLSVASSAEDALLDKISAALAGRRALLFLDNCDQISAGIGAVVYRILRATDHLKVLATSQQQLNFIGERILPLPPLGLPALRRPAGETDLQEIASAPAVALLLTRIRAVQPAFVLTADNAPAIVEICDRLDGMPLALELAAARFALFSAGQVLERLDQRFRFLVSDVAGRDARHRNLMALLDWSFDLLSADEQQFLAWLGVFVQGWTMEAAIEIASALGHEPGMAVDILAALVRKSLVVADHAASPMRYRLLESVREFALGRLVTSGAEKRARDAHLVFVRGMAEAAHSDMLAGRISERGALLVQELGNIESAVDHALAAGRNVIAALAIAGSLVLCLKGFGLEHFGRRLSRRALELSPPEDSIERGRATLCLGVLLWPTRDFDGAHDALSRAIRIGRNVRDDWTVAYGAGARALLLADAGRLDEAHDDIVVAEATANRLDDDLLRGLSGLARGWVCLARNANAEALEVLQHALDLGADLHQRHYVEVYAGLALFRLGQDVAAATSLYAGMRNGLSLRSARGVAASVEASGYLAERLGRFQDAARFLGAAARTRERTAIPLNSLWIPHHEHAVASLQAAMSPFEYSAASDAGARMREEDVANDAAAFLGTLVG
jgi:predicted ATPase/DNA-binding winged helix-turn-helix (wHTH) protein